MLTKLIVRNFKGLEYAEIELGNPVVFIGPNDSGKTSALQALTLWDLGLRRWTEKRGELAPPQRPGVAVNRRDLVGVPVLSARHLWRELRVRQTFRDSGGQRTENIRMEVIVEGVTGQQPWSCGLEFDYTNEESIYCRPLRTVPDGTERMPVPPQKLWPRMALLNPMSGLVSNETRLEPGAIDVRLGEGRTAEVLRNLCMRVVELPDGKARWKALSDRIASLFGVTLDTPHLIPARGEVQVTYRTKVGSRLDLSSAGRGMQQTLLLLSFINLHPDSVLLLDEPDAHLEILRQRQIYELLGEAADDNRTQVICASHSEVILNEAVQQDTVVAFVGSPHRIQAKSQVLKALRDIGFEDYYQAEITGFVLYLEGRTDLALLRSFAHALGHPAAGALERPFLRNVGNHVNTARSHFYGLREAKPDLLGYALFDRLDRDDLNPKGPLIEHMWPRREIENYLLPAVTLRRYAKEKGRASVSGPHPTAHMTSMFEETEGLRWLSVMDQAIRDFVPPIALRDPEHQYWANTKISGELMDPVLATFFRELATPPVMRKRNYHHLIKYLDASEIHQDVIKVLDGIAKQASAVRGSNH
ncbi:MAG: AAA family ATPase [bacterium]|nr:AAA family ATPase [Acidimicrobiia bacterium]MCY4650774.1 AAA family ATPase [bacterium]